MNFKQILALSVLSSIFFFSCQNTQNNAAQDDKGATQTEQSTVADTSSLIGSWEDQSAAALHFTLFADGTAQSDNMSTLLYQKWSVKGNELSLVAESIGNKQSFIDTAVYSIEKLNNNELILKRGDLILEYKKVNNKENKASLEQNSKTLKGQLTLGHEVRSFKPCGSDKTFWISDKTGKLEEQYSKLTAGKKPYTPIFAEIQVENIGKAKEGFPAEYESVYEVRNVLNTRNTSDKDCE